MNAAKLCHPVMALPADDPIGTPPKLASPPSRGSRTASSPPLLEAGVEISRLPLTMADGHEDIGSNGDSASFFSDIDEGPAVPPLGAGDPTDLLFADTEEAPIQLPKMANRAAVTQCSAREVRRELSLGLRGMATLDNMGGPRPK